MLHMKMHLAAFTNGTFDKQIEGSALLGVVGSLCLDVVRRYFLAALTHTQRAHAARQQHWQLDLP